MPIMSIDVCNHVEYENKTSDSLFYTKKICFRFNISTKSRPLTYIVYRINYPQ